MLFRRIQNNTKWVVYNNVINHNMGKIGNLKIPIGLKRSYVKLISFFPMSKKQEKTYLNLDTNKKLPYLFKYLIKQMRKEGFKKSQIDYLVGLKNKYDYTYKNKISKTEKSDRILMNLISKNYQRVLDINEEDKKIKEDFDKLSGVIKLMINSLIDDKILMIKQNEKKWKKENDRRNTLNQGIDEEISYGKSDIGELKTILNQLEDDVSEWDAFIEEEVQKRLKNRINSFEKKTRKGKKVKGEKTQSVASNPLDDIWYAPGEPFNTSLSSRG